VALRADRAQLQQKAADLQVKQVHPSGGNDCRPLRPPQRSSRPMPAPQSRRRPSSKLRNSSWRRRRSIWVGLRFAARSMAMSPTF
jgi:hypothetical protein